MRYLWLLRKQHYEPRREREGVGGEVLSVCVSSIREYIPIFFC